MKMINGKIENLDNIMYQIYLVLDYKIDPIWYVISSLFRNIESKTIFQDQILLANDLME